MAEISGESQKIGAKHTSQPVLWHKYKHPSINWPLNIIHTPLNPQQSGNSINPEKKEPSSPCRIFPF
ncbi:hypothetical protein [Snodgrassella sp.]|uniref:hypothetical protein n=1 Tax=Snodgrassella sp. TaxID=2815304 RepID=UPI0025908455|nr:hypothetical protein [Snodgrassella sp.]